MFPPIPARFQPGLTEPSWGELRLGAADNPFAVPNLRLETGPAPAKVRIGWLRSVANVYHAFAAGSFADELAAAAGADPKEHLLRLIGPPRIVDLADEAADYANYAQSIEEHPIDTGRLRGVVELAAGKAGWGKKLAAGSGLGIAAHRSFLSYVAAVAEVTVGDDGKIRVDAVHCALDCGIAVNPDRVRAQIEGSIVFGLGAALKGEITAKGGAVEQSNFHDYEILRITEMPATVGAWLVESDAAPGGVGEPVVPPIAPAVANAIFAATGVRLRELPLARALAEARASVT